MSIEVQSQIVTDDGRALVDMARLGLGIIMVDPLLIKNSLDSQQLVPILTNWQHPESQPINLICLGKNI
ncbi:hypothetical protein IMCC3135_28240 [Granulosicoccus antarcticus IMCC3135]|uniref:LysR substrate-binding domain-containing protein n=1 Tax=Granulosicoccus antarcticus IMCC3135 TaxID=1192854 RepID=A0A2Z2P2U8_9GAMM|nr:hypothetical protein IMCC3135_28240 [Granulosicoccus antarcticus IMCC3135]